VVLKPEVTAIDTADRTIGSKPVGLPAHILISNFNWKTPIEGIELDIALSHRGRVAARTDNAVFIPARARLDLGGRYKFNIAKRSATFRLQMVNVFDNPGYGLAGSGIYTSNPGRYVQGYLAVDL
jgi:iron complex outermembrane receptor protein